MFLLNSIDTDDGMRVQTNAYGEKKLFKNAYSFLDHLPRGYFAIR